MYIKPGIYNMMLGSRVIVLYSDQSLDVVIHNINKAEGGIAGLKAPQSALDSRQQA